LSFALDQRLAADTIPIGDLALSRLLLMNDARFLWLVLAPRRENLTELIDLSAADRAMLMDEIVAVSRALVERPGVAKINVGALGNIVRQLHVHVVARRIGDAAWPGPVWGQGAPIRYRAQDSPAIVGALASQLIRAAAR
jgi:diadenosine tetraphosphate (Ap4A) HIT family hydrolase